MSTYSPPDLLQQWAQGNLTADQARPAGTSHLIQNLVTLLQRLTDLEKLGAPWARLLEQARPDAPKPKP